MIPQQNLVDALYTDIKDSIGDLIGNRVYEGRAKQDCSLPCVVFNIVADTPEPWFVTDSLDADVQVDFYGLSRLGSKAIRNVSDTLLIDLHTNGLDIDGYDYSFIDYAKGTRGIRTTEDENIRIRTQFNIVASEEVNVS